jgi:hypothetical protein
MQRANAQATQLRVVALRWQAGAGECRMRKVPISLGARTVCAQCV